MAGISKVKGSGLATGAATESLVGIDDNATSTAITIDASEKVGIGTSSPSEKLEVYGDTTGDVSAVISNNDFSGTASTAELKFLPGREAGGANPLKIVAGKEGNWSSAATRDGFMAFHTVSNEVSAERMRIDSSGNVLVGKTTAGAAIGVQIEPAGAIALARNNSANLYLNRTGSDGDLISFRKDGTTVGSIQSRSSLVTTLIFDPRPSGVGVSGTTNALIPTDGDGSTADNAKDIGIAGTRWKNLYLSGGVYLGGTGATNKLDDYEEGTFTPAYYSSGGGETVTHDLQQGRYTKVGDLVTIHILLGTDAISGGSSNCRISGLPFTASKTTSTSVGLGYGFLSTGPRYVIVNNLSSSLQLYPTHGSATQLPWASLNTNSNDNRLYITMSYWAT